MNEEVLISALARSVLAGELDVEQIFARLTRTLGHAWRWLRPLSQRIAESFADQTVPSHRTLSHWLLTDTDFRIARRRYGRRISILEWIAEPPRLQPIVAASQWGLPILETTAALADWLALSPNELEWFADPKHLNAKSPNEKLHHYTYRIISKNSGGERLIEIPKSNLKAVHRRILDGLLNKVPAHPATHGFVRGRSIATFATPHVNRTVVLRLDIENFFPAFPASRAQAIFRTLGYPQPVADRLAGLCTNMVPYRALTTATQQTKDLYRRTHLPQGAPTSPALANIAAYHLDCRLTGLAKAAGAVYTRYADDLAFSGDENFRREVSYFKAEAAAIALEEGFAINHRKTRIMQRGVRQQLAGVVVNEHPSLRRTDLEKLEAILTNAARKGPASQNRDAHPNYRAHLEGCIGFVKMINPVKAERLYEIFKSIHWD